MAKEVDIAGMIAGLQLAGLSQSRIAQEAKLSRATVHRAALGATPTLETFFRVQRLYDRTVNRPTRPIAGPPLGGKL